jgi:hypothetical protein
MRPALCRLGHAGARRCASVAGRHAGIQEKQVGDSKQRITRRSQYRGLQRQSGEQ